MDRAEIIRLLEHELTSTPEDLVAAWLYGSTARDERKPTSDVDVALLYRSDPPHVLDAPPNRLEDRLERALRLPVEVVVLNRTPVDLIHRVLLEGVLLLERDRSARIAFEVKARREYFDLLPILDRYRSASGRSG